MRRAVAWIAVFVALALAFVAGRVTAPRPPVVAPRRAVAAPVITQKTTIEGSSCEERLAFATRLAEAERLARVGAPVPFPEDLPAAFRPDGFENAVRGALADCDTTLVLDHVDCSEFPCWAWFSQPPGSMNHAGDNLTGCAAWTDRFGSAPQSSANGTLMSDERGPLEYALVGPHPEDMDWDDNASKRFHARMEDGRQQLMDAWGARDPTEEENLDADIAFWRTQLDKGLESAAGILDDLERKKKRQSERP
jgi:hypothetical protein